jgi:cell division protein FtsB
MGNVDEIVLEHQKKMLASMKKRRDSLNNGIAKLEYAIEHPTLPYNIDYEAIKEEARKDIEFLDKCEKERMAENKH